MRNNFYTPDFDNAWLACLDTCMAEGGERSPRGLVTKEILFGNLRFDMAYPILNIKERELGTAFLCYEPFWVLSGNNLVSDIKPYAKLMTSFSDDGVFLSGAYGPKLVDQLPYIVECLSKDISSRQAVVNIWREKPGGTKDCPCTCTYQFLIRDDTLHMSVYMRSNDLFLGTPYDVFTQTMVAYAVCLLVSQKIGVQIKMGHLSLMVGSMHIYQNNWDKIWEIISTYNYENIITGEVCNTNEVDPSPPALTYDYGLSFSDLKEYLRHCAITLANDLHVDYGFLKGLQPKGGKNVMQRV